MVQTSISNTVAQAIIFKPDARLQKPKKKRNGLGEVQPLGEERLFGGNVFWVKQHEEMVA